LLSYYNMEPTYYGKADILRLVIVYFHGGIYIDADSVWIPPKTFDFALHNTFFAGHEKAGDKLIANGTFGAIPKCDLLRHFIDTIIQCYYKQRIIKQRQIIRVTGPQFFTKKLEPYLPKGKIQTGEKINGVTIYPYHYFYPLYWHQDNSEIEVSAEKFPESITFQYGMTSNHFKSKDFVAS